MAVEEVDVTGTERLKEDMAYVRAAAERSENVHVPAYYLLWAAICLCGFALIDFADSGRWIAAYWMVAGPVGFGLSGWLGARASRLAGQSDPEKNKRWRLHWLAFMAAGVLGLGLVVAGQLTWAGFSSLWPLLMALTYFQAGVHMERRLLPIGLMLGIGYLVTLFLPDYGFTMAGVLVAAALTAQAFLGAPTRAPAS